MISKLQNCKNILWGKGLWTEQNRTIFYRSAGLLLRKSEQNGLNANFLISVWLRNKEVIILKTINIRLYLLPWICSSVHHHVIMHIVCNQINQEHIYIIINLYVINFKTPHHVKVMSVNCLSIPCRIIISAVKSSPSKLCYLLSAPSSIVADEYFAWCKSSVDSDGRTRIFIVLL